MDIRKQENFTSATIVAKLDTSEDDIDRQISYLLEEIENSIVNKDGNIVQVEVSINT